MTAVLRFPLTPGQAIPDRDHRDWVTSAELVAESRISLRQLDYWTRTGLLHVLDRLQPGSGHLNRYHSDEVARARAVVDLLDAGLSLQAIRQIVDDFLTDGVITVGHITIARADQEPQ